MILQVPTFQMLSSTELENFHQKMLELSSKALHVYRDRYFTSSFIKDHLSGIIYEGSFYQVALTVSI